MQSSSTPRIPVSWGELIDKITILEIKYARLESDQALLNVGKELALLTREANDIVSANDQVRRLKDALKQVNEALWEIEDRIREKEKANEFDDDFIKLARSVYIKNDERARIKREINHFLLSDLTEEKSYSQYTATE
jgi:hypothetical protein